jgi:putative Holliday junction resolvase
MSNEPQISHILGVDYGQSKIGLAMADSETRIAFGYGILENNKELFQKLAEIIKKEGILKVIIGIPGFRNKGNGGNQEIYRGFGEELKKVLPEIEIEFTNEMFTTNMAQDNLKEAGVKNMQTLDDQEAARIILQSWLDKP